MDGVDLGWTVGRCGRSMGAEVGDEGRGEALWGRWAGASFSRKSRRAGSSFWRGSEELSEGEEGEEPQNQPISNADIPMSSAEALRLVWIQTVR